jgi:signal transduction histidine kinase
VEATRRQILARWVLLACVVVVAALTSEQEDREPVALVLAIAVLMTIAEVAVVSTRRLRASTGLMAQSTAMARLGVVNAVKHASPSRIEVVVGAQDGEVHLEISTRGDGGTRSRVVMPRPATLS